MNTSRAWAEIDLDALATNLSILRKKVGPRVSILLVAKADAYGHGAVAIAHQAMRSGAAALGVTTCTEALELREAGVAARLLVLGAVFGQEAPQALELGVEFGVSSAELAGLLHRTARSLGRKARVHLKIDTGMHRLGVPPEQAIDLLEAIQASKFMELAGVMTHMAPTDGARSGTAQAQLRRFAAVLEEARAKNLLRGRNVWIHAANSACILTGLDPLFDAVRPGICAYGITPDPGIDSGDLVPVMSVRTKVVHLQEIQIGAQVGYGGTWTATRKSRIATLPIGYDDGVDWRLSNKGHVLVRGRRVPIVGRISMDYTTIDVTEVPHVRLGDPVTLIGSDGDQRIRAEDLAETIGTIPYEVICSIGKRVRRIYKGGEPIDPRHGEGHA